MAQEYFTDDVGCVLGLQGSRVLEQGNDILREVVERLGDSRAALHAWFALGNSVGRAHKAIIPDDRSLLGLVVKLQCGDPAVGRELMRSALVADPQKAADTFGHISYKARVERFSDWLADQGEPGETRRSLTTFYETLHARGVRTDVLEDIRECQKTPR